MYIALISSKTTSVKYSGLKFLPGRDKFMRLPDKPKK